MVSSTESGCQLSLLIYNRRQRSIRVDIKENKYIKKLIFILHKIVSQKIVQHNHELIMD